VPFRRRRVSHTRPARRSHAPSPPRPPLAQV
jgi:hypothetical protein